MRQLMCCKLCCAAATALHADTMPLVLLQDGWTPLMLACHSGHLEVMRLLLAAGARVNMADKVSADLCMSLGRLQSTGAGEHVSEKSWKPQ
jgi:hypothetical protein